jgi:hypothetical protein
MNPGFSYPDYADSLPVFSGSSLSSPTTGIADTINVGDRAVVCAVIAGPSSGSAGLRIDSERPLGAGQRSPAMWRLPLVQLLALAVMTEAVRAEVPAAAAPGSGPIATRQTMFVIPFQIQKAQQPSQEPAEIRLFVSTDRGVTWKPYAKVTPTQGHFLFRAVGDGEYWFLVRTLDRSGQVRPQGPDRPELRVLVDTTPPKLDIKAVRGEAGQMTARWQVAEAAPKPESLKLHYRTAPDAPWQPVTIDWQKVKASGSTQSGEVTWWPPAGTKDLEIRAEVADAAGNPAVGHDRVGSDGSLVAASKTPADQTPAPGTATQPWRPAKGDTPPGTQPAAHDLNTPAARGVETAQRTYPDTGRSAAETDPRHTGQPPANPVPGAVSPAVQNQYLPPPAQQRASAPTDGTPGTPRPRMVNSRVFELEYDLGGTGTAAPGRVELWGIRDGSRTWTSFGHDPDARSPILVTVSDEGLYGFRVVQTDPKAPAQPPQPSDPPDVWIGVDLSKPAAKIVSAERGLGEQSNQLILRWEASDAMLTARPISLFYSESPGGSWATIAPAVENTGTYAWTIDQRVPERIYLRLEVRDEAGNLTVVELPQAVVIQQRPSGARIRDVRPVGQSARRLSGRDGQYR